MKYKTWTVKTPKGRIYPTWIFDSKEEADNFAVRINEEFPTHNHIVVEVEIKTL